MAYPLGGAQQAEVDDSNLTASREEQAAGVAQDPAWDPVKRILFRFVFAYPLRPLFARKGLHRGALVLRTVCVVGFAGMSLFQANQARKLYGELAPKSPFLLVNRGFHWINELPFNR